jgi:hypothetical protein
VFLQKPASANSLSHSQTGSFKFNLRATVNLEYTVLLKKKELIWREKKKNSKLLLQHQKLQIPDTNVCEKRSELGQSNTLNGKNVFESTSHLFQSTGKTSFTEWYAKPLQAPICTRLSCCAILACSKVGT